MNPVIYQWICIALSLMWLVMGLFVGTPENKQHWFTSCSVFAAASLVIGALS